jgi:hypothetical protein
MEHLSRADRVARGKDARDLAPLESHAEFTPDGSRDPVGLLLEQAKTRVPELVPVRHGRMLVSDVEAAIAEFRSQLKAKRVKATEKMVAKAHTHDSMQALGKLTTVAGGQQRIISDPPLIEPVEEVFADTLAGQIYDLIREVMGKYRRTLQSDRKHLVEYFTLVQVARKVVGVGSVGTRAWIALMDGVDRTEPLFLQAKEAQPSVLADHCGRSQYRNQGERVVAGQHLMQAESDIFLGWTHVVGPDGVDRDYYVRQLKDWKFSMPIEQMIPSGMKVYARLCGWTLARAHARSGDRIALAAYLGGSAKVRPGDRRLRRNIRRPERTRLRRAPGRRERRPSRSHHRDLAILSHTGPRVRRALTRGAIALGRQVRCMNQETGFQRPNSRATSPIRRRASTFTRTPILIRVPPLPAPPAAAGHRTGLHSVLPPHSAVPRSSRHPNATKRAVPRTRGSLRPLRLLQPRRTVTTQFVIVIAVEPEMVSNNPAQREQAPRPSRRPVRSRAMMVFMISDVPP